MTQVQKVSSGTRVDTEVLIIGMGPAGVTLANLLALWKVDAVVVEAETEIYQYPRAVGIDDESLRTYQTIGVLERLQEDLLQNTPIRYYTSWRRVMAHVEPSVRPFGLPRRNTFLQPLFEATMRQHLSSSETTTTVIGSRLKSFEQSPAGVEAVIEDKDGMRSTIRAKYLVGADGGRSSVRRIAGIEMLGSTAGLKWLVVDVKDDQLDAPYSAVYCHPTRPVLMIPLPYGHRRFEFKVLEGDDEEKLTDLDYVLENLVAPMYPKGTPLPQMVRATQYLHHSRTAETFQRGRVFLAGDSAHMQPPFFGQGMNSGMRDVTNLAWKLALVTRGAAGPRLLDTYDAERREHASTMVEFATKIGRMYSPKNTVTERVRDLVFRGLQRIPGGRDYILQMKFKPLPYYKRGVVIPYEGGKDNAVGRMFGQPTVETSEGVSVKLDETLGHSFAVLGLHVDPTQALDTDSLEWWHATGARFITVDAPRKGLRPELGERRKRPTELEANDVQRIEDSEGAFRDWLLKRPGDNVIVLRPDRYVAAVTSVGQLPRITEQLRSTMGI